MGPTTHRQYGGSGCFYRQRKFFLAVCAHEQLSYRRNKCDDIFNTASSSPEDTHAVHVWEILCSSCFNAESKSKLSQIKKPTKLRINQHKTTLKREACSAARMYNMFSWCSLFQGSTDSELFMKSNGRTRTCQDLGHSG